MPTEMTVKDLEEAKPMASQLLAAVTTMRPPAAVASLALAFAGVVHLAGCGEVAAMKLFGHYFASIGVEQERVAREGADS